MLQIYKDRVAVWREAPFIKKISTKKLPIGTVYLERGSMVFKPSTAPMFRYVKNYKIGKTKFCLFVRSFEASAEVVEEKLDIIKGKLTEKYVKAALDSATQDNFTYTDFWLDEIAPEPIVIEEKESE